MPTSHKDTTTPWDIGSSQLWGVGGNVAIGVANHDKRRVPTGSRTNPLFLLALPSARGPVFQP